MNASTPVLTTIPKSNVGTIKDAGRNITENLGLSKPFQDKVGATLKGFLGASEEKRRNIKSDDLQSILDQIEGKRARIIALLAEKECVRQIAGTGKHDITARTKLANEVLDELVGKINATLKPQTI